MRVLQAIVAPALCVSVALASMAVRQSTPPVELCAEPTAGTGGWPVNNGLLEIAFQIQSGVQAGYLISVAVEHFGRPVLEQPWQSHFPGLTPAGMIYGRVDVGIEAVLMRRGTLPRADRLVRHESNRDDRL